MLCLLVEIYAETLLNFYKTTRDHITEDSNFHIHCHVYLISDIPEDINPLKTKCICFIQGLSAYRAVNTLHFGYKNQSVNVL
jgi:hypothetical protein